MAYQGGTIKSTSINGVKMYSVSGQRSLATWLTPKKQKALRKDKEYQKRVELIQDLRFETATTKIKATPDGEFLIASGVYPPQVKVYELRELSLKFERHLISEIIDFEVLSEDYSKLAFLCADRSVCLHAKFGSYYSLRIPRMGRDMTYDAWSCDLLCAASSPDLYRINLEQGRFLNSLSTRSPALNVVSRSKLHGLVACGGEDGAVECFDMRIKSPVGRINTISHAGDIDQEVTAIEFDNDGGFLMAVGGSAGKVLIYDLRSSHPIRVKDHMYGSPILDIKWHQSLNSERPKLITTDNHIVRIWDPHTRLTGGVLILRNKFYIIFYRGNDFLPLEVANLVVDREAQLRRCQLQEEGARLKAIESFSVSDETDLTTSSIGTLSEFQDIQTKYGLLHEVKSEISIKMEAEKEKLDREIRDQEHKLKLLKRKLQRSERELSEINSAWKMSEKDVD